MKLLCGLLIAWSIVMILPASVMGWGDTAVKAIGPWDTVKKPYTSGWGHCTKCGSCSGGLCEPAESINDADTENSEGEAQVYINQNTVKTIQSNYLSSVANPNYIIDCSSIGSSISTTIDLSGSSPFYDVEQPSRYAIKFSAPSTAGILIK